MRSLPVITALAMLLVGAALAVSADGAVADRADPVLRHRASLVEVAVHRGLRTRFRGHRADEDSARACVDAVVHGANACEVDVRIAADGVPILMHDPTTGRVTRGGRRCDLTVATTGSARLRRCRLNHGDRITRLVDLGAAMRPYAGHKALVVELKGRAFTGAELSRIDRVLRVHHFGGRHGHLAYESYERSNVALISRIDPGAPAYLISRRALSVDEVTASGADGLILPYAALVDALAQDPGYVAAMTARGRGVFPWRVNTPSALRHALAFGVRGVITDNLATVRAATALRRS